MDQGPPKNDGEVNRLLALIRAGEPEALGPLFEALYHELRAQARGQMGGLMGHTLQPTALVNEAFFRIQKAGGAWNDRSHFLLAASRVMRHVLVDHYRRRRSLKRDGHRLDLELNELAEAFSDRASDLVGLDEALAKLEARDPTMAKTVDLRFFGGVPMEEIAEILGVPLRSLQRNWAITKKWLHGQLGDDDELGAPVTAS